MLIECLLFIFLLLSIYYWRATTYWQRKGVFSPPGEFFFGHIRKIIFSKIDIQDFFDELYQKHKDKKLIGFYNFCEPMLLVTDLEYINRIFVSDFNSFSDQQVYPDKKSEPLLAYNPFVSSGEDKLKPCVEETRSPCTMSYLLPDQSSFCWDFSLPWPLLNDEEPGEWKSRRALHVSQQTAAKLKEGLTLMAKNTQMMVDYIKGEKSKPLVVEHISKYYTINNASSFFYGFESNAFNDPENAFRKYGFNILKDSLGYFATIRTFIPILSHIFTLRFTKKELDDFFIGMASQILDHRTKNKINRNDLVGQLVKIDEKLKSEGKPGLVPEEIAGHFFTAYVDSVETSSALLSFLLLELANRQDFQERLREEIMLVGTKVEDFDYEKVHSIKYLSVILNGMKYALLQLKMAVVTLLLNFKIISTTKFEEDKKVENAKEATLFQVPEKDSTVIFQSL